MGRGGRHLGGQVAVALVGRHQPRDGEEEQCGADAQQPGGGDGEDRLYGGGHRLAGVGVGNGVGEPGHGGPQEAGHQEDEEGDEQDPQAGASLVLMLLGLRIVGEHEHDGDEDDAGQHAGQGRVPAARDHELEVGRGAACGRIELSGGHHRLRGEGGPAQRSPEFPHRTGWWVAAL